MPTVSSPFTTEADEQGQQGQGSTIANGQTSAVGNATPTATNTTLASGGGSSAPTAAGSSGAAISGGVAQGGTSGTPTNSGSFTNLSKYINANQNFNQAGGGLAGKIASNINSQAAQTNQGIQNAFNTFSNQSNQNIAGAQANANDYSAALANPYQFSQNQNNVNNLDQALNANYTGPNSLNDLNGSNNYAALQNQANNVSQEANQTNTESGRYATLANMFGNNNTYSAGQQNLDNLFLQNNPSQMNTLAQTRQVGTQLNNTLNQAQSNAQNLASSNANIASNIAQTSQNALQGGLTNMQNQINNQVSTDQAQAQALQTALQNNQALTPTQLAMLGITSPVSYNTSANTTPFGTYYSNTQSGQSPQYTNYQTFGVNPLNYVTAPSTINASDVATQDQYNNYNALSNLLGQTNSFLNSPSSTTPYSPVNTAGLNSAIQSQQQSYDAAINALLPAIDAAYAAGPNGGTPGAPTNGTQFATGLANGTEAYAPTVEKYGIQPFFYYPSLEKYGGNTTTLANLQAILNQYGIGSGYSTGLSNGAYGTPTSLRVADTSPFQTGNNGGALNPE